MNKPKAKTTKALTITTTYWVKANGKLQYEAKAKDLFGNKYTLTIDSHEPLPGKHQKNIVSKLEWGRIKIELNHLYKKKYNEVLEAFNKAYLKKQQHAKQDSKH